MDDARSVPEVRRVRYATTDADEATTILCEHYGSHEPTYGSGVQDRRMRLTSTAVESPAGTFSVERLTQNVYSAAFVPHASSALLFVPLGGLVRSGTGREESSGPILVPYWRPSWNEFTDADVATGQIDLDGVRRVGAEISGLEPGRVEFDGWTPISSGWHRPLADALAHLGRSFGSDHVASSALLRAEAYRYLATTMLSAFPNTTRSVDHVGRDSGEPATVRRAVEFIDAHAGEDIDVTRIAEAARIGVRGLQDAFRRHRGQSPMDYVRRVRLEGARRDLQSGDPTRGDTVAAIAARWGFGHPGRFSVVYREAYGTSPGQTLRS